ncbi:MAG: class D sortase [Acidobacteriaceae bacterium]
MPECNDGLNGSRTSAGAKPQPARFIRTSIEYALLVTGVVLLAVFAAAQVDRFLTSDALLVAFPAAEPSAPATPRASMAPEDPSLHPGGAAANADGSGHAIDTTDAAGMPLAVLRIPAIHLDVPVLDGTDVLTLNHAAGRIAGTALPGEAGNMGIAAHRDGFFRNLGKVRIGDPIELETRNGVERYIVERTQIVMPDDVSVLDPRPAPSLTLVTCYPFHYLGRAPQRYIVTASLEPATRVRPPVVQ